MKERDVRSDEHLQGVYVRRECGHVQAVLGDRKEPCPYCEHNLIYQDDLVDDALARAVVRSRR